MREGKFRKKPAGTALEPRLDPAMRVLKALHSASVPAELCPEELERQRRNQEILGNLVAPMAGMRWDEIKIGAMPAAWMGLERPHRHRRAVLYCHGGGYTSGNLGYSKVLASKLTQVTGFDVLSFEYRLAPEHPYPAALNDAVSAWDYLMHLGYGARDIIVAGDSAGGNLALVLCHELKAERRMLPGALLLMSPWTDMIGSGKSHTANVDKDPIFGGNPEYAPPANGVLPAVRPLILAYVGKTDPRNPYLSPVFGSYEKFPPMLIQVGTAEILESDSEIVYQRAIAAGVDATLTRYYGMFHVFQILGDALPEGATAWEEVRQFIAKKFLAKG